VSSRIIPQRRPADYPRKLLRYIGPATPAALEPGRGGAGSRSRRNSSIRARIAAKSSAARGRITAGGGAGCTRAYANRCPKRCVSLGLLNRTSHSAFVISKPIFSMRVLSNHDRISARRSPSETFRRRMTTVDNSKFVAISPLSLLHGWRLVVAAMLCNVRNLLS
jgi:hypothetical protein